MSLSKSIRGKFHIVRKNRDQAWFSNEEWFRYCEYLD